MKLMLITTTFRHSLSQMLSSREKPINTCRTHHNPLPPSPEVGLFSLNYYTLSPVFSLPGAKHSPLVLLPHSQVSFMEDAAPSHHRQQRLCRIELLGIRIQCGFLHLSMREKPSKPSWLAPHHRTPTHLSTQLTRQQGPHPCHLP